MSKCDSQLPVICEIDSNGNVTVLPDARYGENIGNIDDKEIFFIYIQSDSDAQAGAVFLNGGRKPLSILNKTGSAIGAGTVVSNGVYPVVKNSVNDTLTVIGDGGVSPYPPLCQLGTFEGSGTGFFTGNPPLGTIGNYNGFFMNADSVSFGYGLMIDAPLDPSKNYFLELSADNINMGISGALPMLVYLLVRRNPAAPRPYGTILNEALTTLSLPAGEGALFCQLAQVSATNKVRIIQGVGDISCSASDNVPGTITSPPPYTLGFLLEADTTLPNQVFNASLYDNGALVHNNIVFTDTGDLSEGYRVASGFSYNAGNGPPAVGDVQTNRIILDNSGAPAVGFPLTKLGIGTAC